MPPLRVEDDSKLGELIVYISDKSAGDPRFGATKLNKLLYFSDFLAFGNFGEPITCAIYTHRKWGPAPRHFEEVRDALLASASLKIETRQLNSGNRQNRTVALREASLQDFSQQQIDLVDDLIKQHWDRTADEISEASHNYVGWKMTKDGEAIPYESIFLSDTPLTVEEIYKGQQLAQQDIRWKAA